MRPLVLTALAGLALAALAVVLWPRSDESKPSVCGPVDSTPADVGIDAASQATLCLLNRERASAGLRPLAVNGLLTQAAAAHSEDMVRRAYFEHTSPDGRSVQDRIRATGYARGANASSGENIEWGVGAKAAPSAIVAKWMASPPHRADILRDAFTEIGIGIALGAPDVPGRRPGQGATYTTDFGGRTDPSLQAG